MIALLSLIVESAATNDGVVITGASVVAVGTAIAWTIKKLYADKQKADAAHVECQKIRAEEANARARELDKMLQDERERDA